MSHRVTAFVMGFVAGVYTHAEHKDAVKEVVPFVKSWASQMKHVIDNMADPKTGQDK